jgi:glycosyltransferase involved in cell wall biosynthesis
MKIAVVGTVGLPACYGGWETLAENLARYHHDHQRPEQMTVYCTAHAYATQPDRYLSTQLVYSRFKANGVQSTIYDIVTMVHAVRSGADVILILGVSGTVFLPILKRVTSARIITNIDGIEWRREKWKGLAKSFLKLSERAAVRHSDVVLADNQGIADYVFDTYGRQAEIIAYGGDHAAVEPPAGVPTDMPHLPDQYAFALCRIEPENNVHTILEAFSKTDRPLVFVGNWMNSTYGAELKARWADTLNLHLLDPIYDPDILYYLRKNAQLYVHGHSAGGTNPSLVEMMYFDCPIVAFDCIFNRHTTEDKAAYFKDINSLTALLVDPEGLPVNMGKTLTEIANCRYTWDKIGSAYFEVCARHP